MNNTEALLADAEWQQQLETFNYHCAYCLKPFDDLENHCCSIVPLITKENTSACLFPSLRITRPSASTH